MKTLLATTAIIGLCTFYSTAYAGSPIGGTSNTNINAQHQGQHQGQVQGQMQGQRQTAHGGNAGAIAGANSSSDNTGNNFDSDTGDSLGIMIAPPSFGGNLSNATGPKYNITSFSVGFPFIGGGFADSKITPTVEGMIDLVTFTHATKIEPDSAKAAMMRAALCTYYGEYAEAAFVVCGE